MNTLHYIPIAAPIPLSEIERNTETIRRCLRKYGKRLQKLGEIPPEVSEAEINEEMERYVPRIVQAIHRSNVYPLIREKSRGHLQRYIEELIKLL